MELHVIVVAKGGDLIVNVIDRRIVTRTAENAVTLRGSISKAFENL